MRRGLVLIAALGVAACHQGEGSDIGPDIPRLPNASFRVLVKSDDGAGVASALLRIDGADKSWSSRMIPRNDRSPSALGTFSPVKPPNRRAPAELNEKLTTGPSSSIRMLAFERYCPVTL